MEVRPFVTTGIALASAGALIAAMPAITPPATPPDVTVAAAVPDSVYADVALRQSTEDLFNAFFSGYPDTTGPAGAVGLALLFSDELFGSESLPSSFVSGGIVGAADFLTTDIPLVNSFITGGIVGLAQELVGDDVVAQAFLAEGFVGVAQLLSDALFGDDSLPSAFISDGFVGVAQLLSDTLFGEESLPSRFVSDGVVGVADFLTEGNELANTFVNGGFVAATEFVLLNLTADPVAEGAITSFFSGYPPELPNPENPDEPFPAGPAGIVGLTHFILDALTGNIQEPPISGSAVEELTVEQLSVPESGDSLLAATTGPADAQDLPEANEPVNPGARTFNLNVGTQLNTGAVDPVDTIDPVDTTDVDTIDPVDTTDPTTVDSSDPDPTVTPVAATTGSGSGSAPAASPPVAPTPPPATDPVDDPVDPVSTEGDADDSKKVTEEELNSGNKFEPDPILLENGSGGGGSAWDETVKRWQDFGSKLGFGGGAAEPDGGETEGSEAGS
jgi:hypothetical protein